MVRIHKYITVTILYIPPRDAASPHYTTLDITNCIKHIIETPDSIFTGDLNTHSHALWYPYTDITEGYSKINNSNHVTINTSTGVPNMTYQQTSSPDITYVSSTQLGTPNIHSSDH